MSDGVVNVSDRLYSGWYRSYRSFRVTILTNQRRKVIRLLFLDLANNSRSTPFISLIDGDEHVAIPGYRSTHRGIIHLFQFADVGVAMIFRTNDLSRHHTFADRARGPSPHAPHMSKVTTFLDRRSPSMT